MDPSNFLKHPFDCVTSNFESEIVALNIMVILARTGNTFRPLSWNEYVTERERDGEFAGLERQYFDRVVGYCESAEKAQSFSPGWRNANA